MDEQRRRTLSSLAKLSVVAIALLAGFHSAATAQTERQWKIGILTSGVPVRWDTVERATIEGLREFGYIEGKNTTLIKRTATWPDPRMQQYADEMVAQGVDIIITSCGWSTGSALKATKTIPIVMGAMHDPIGRGFIKSLARPGTNVTGSTGHIPGLGPKLIEYVQLGVPNVRTIGVLSNLKNPTHRARYTEIETAARALGLTVVELDMHRLAKTETLAATAREAKVGALIVMPDDDFYYEFLEQIYGASKILKVPNFFTKRDLIDLGGVFAYGVDPAVIFKRSAHFVDKILKGEKPAEMPVEYPTNLEFAINLKNARDIGIEIPRAALVRADWVVR